MRTPTKGRASTRRALGTQADRSPIWYLLFLWRNGYYVGNLWHSGGKLSVMDRVVYAGSKARIPWKIASLAGNCGGGLYLAKCLVI